MSNDAAADTLPGIASRVEFAAAIHWGLQQAVARGAHRLLWIDGDFRDWPLDELSLLAGLAEWLHRPQRRLVMIARDWGQMRARHPRFCAWRRTWSHALDMRSPPDDEAGLLPTLLLDDTRVLVRLSDPLHWRGRCGLDPRESTLLFAEFDALAQRSDPAFPVTQLGL